MESEENRGDKITYSETRTINIGDYESIKTNLMYTTKIRNINTKEGTLSIIAGETIDAALDEEAFEASVKRAMNRVKKCLNTREAYIRSQTARFTDHDTETKGLMLKLVAIRAWKKLRKKVQVSLREIDDLDQGVSFEVDEE